MMATSDEEKERLLSQDGETSTTLQTRHDQRFTILEQQRRKFLLSLLLIFPR